MGRKVRSQPDIGALAVMTVGTILVAGAGALGSFLAARLIGGGAQVSLLARGERLAQVARTGLLIAMDRQIGQAQVTPSADCRELPCPDLIVLACKSGDVPALLALMRPCLGPATTFLTLQNGVEAPQLVAQACPQTTVLASRVHGFFELQGGVVRHVGVTPSITFGLAHGGRMAALGELAHWLTAAGIAHHQASDIGRELWEKLLLAAALGGVGAAYAMAAGEMLAQTEPRAALHGAMREVQAVAQAQGVALAPDCVQTTFGFISGFPAQATTSLHRDLEARLPSE